MQSGKSGILMFDSDSLSRSSEVEAIDGFLAPVSHFCQARSFTPDILAQSVWDSVMPILWWRATLNRMNLSCSGVILRCG